jgi:hypothetical protein
MADVDEEALVDAVRAALAEKPGMGIKPLVKHLTTNGWAVDSRAVRNAIGGGGGRSPAPHARELLPRDRCASHRDRPSASPIASARPGETKDLTRIAHRRTLYLVGPNPKLASILRSSEPNPSFHLLPLVGCDTTS